MKFLLLTVLAATASAQWGSAYPSYNYNYGATGLASGYNYGSYNYGSVPYTAAPAYGYNNFNYGYNVPRTYVQPRSCAQIITDVWKGDAANPDKYDGRTVTWHMIPEKTIVRNAAENRAATDGFNQVARWVATPEDVQTLGNTVQFYVDWKGSQSNINGAVVPAGGKHRTFHTYNCINRVEDVYGDFGGMFKFMGVP